MKPKSWIEISKESLLHNFNSVKKLVSSKVLVICVVKANAYGHGLSDVVKILDEAGADFFGVDCIEDGLQIRSLGVKKPIIVLGYSPHENIEMAIKNDISLTVYSEETIRHIINASIYKVAKVHIKVETGMGRQGLGQADVLDLALLIKQYNKKIHLEGVSTHFANADDISDQEFTNLQFSRFENTIKLLKENGITPDLQHTSASAGTLLYSAYRLNAVRLGISLYGLWPSKGTRANFENNNFNLKPVLTWKSTVAQVKNIEKGETVSYGRTWKAIKKTKIAVIPSGYYDGYDRHLSNNSKVIINGKFAKVIGRVAMNMFMVDITDIKNVSAGNEVILIGQDGNLEITADELAERVGTINYEIVTRINPQLPRILI